MHRMRFYGFRQFARVGNLPFTVGRAEAGLPGGVGQGARVESDLPAGCVGWRPWVCDPEKDGPER